MSELKEKKVFKKSWVILIIIVLLLLCCLSPVVLAFIFGRDNLIIEEDSELFKEPPWLYIQKEIDNFNAEMELMDLLGIDLGENYFNEVLHDDSDFDFENDRDVKKEEVKKENYSNENFPKLSFEYSSDWKLNEREKNSNLISNAKDLDLTLEKEGYILQVSAVTVGPAGFEPTCYTKDDIDYVRIEDAIVRAYDGISYLYGYMYDDEFDREGFEFAKELYVDNQDYIACGDTYILKIIPTSFWDEEYFSEDYLSAIVSVSLHEKVQKNEKLISEVDSLVRSLLK